MICIYSDKQKKANMNYLTDEEKRRQTYITKKLNEIYYMPSARKLAALYNLITAENLGPDDIVSLRTMDTFNYVHAIGTSTTDYGTACPNAPAGLTWSAGIVTRSFRLSDAIKLLGLPEKDISTAMEALYGLHRKDPCLNPTNRM